MNKKWTCEGRRWFAAVQGVAFALLIAGGAHADAPKKSVYSPLGGPTCKEEVDKSDPNDSSILRCPGVGGYSLVIRQVDSGRSSIAVMSPAGEEIDLDLPRHVTPQMFALLGPAKWRVHAEQGKEIPRALIVRLAVHGDEKRPERVTQTYLAIAKVTPAETCLTDRLLEKERSVADVRRLADSAPSRPCLQPK